MEVLYLLCSIFSISLTSLVHSLFLPFRFFFPSRSVVDSGESISVYEGTVWHVRRRPVHHSFKYNVCYALVDLDRTSHPPPNHLSPDEARRFAVTNGPVFLLTIPPSVGYEQNPLSVYYCYDDDDGSTQDLKRCIAEVTNTPWGERVRFLFNPNSDVVAKPLHVSPFMDMYGNWNIRTNIPGDNLLISISVQHPELGDYFRASLSARRVSSSIADHALFFWLMPHKVAIWIYWHALKLWWKNVSFVQHPMYSKPTYREEALIRDGKLPCCLAMQGETGNSCPVTDSKAKDHQFIWTDAKWPWC